MKLPLSALNNLENIIPELNPIDKKLYYSVTCPSCGKKEAYVYKDKGLIVCSRLNKCGYVSSIFDYLKEDKQLSNKEIVKIFSFGKENIEKVLSIERKNVTTPKNLKFFKSNESSFNTRRAKNYLIKRRIPEKTIEELGYIFDREDPFDKRIFIPFYENNEMVFFTTRDLTGKSFIRWKDPAGIDKHNFVFNIDKMWNTDIIFIFEGLFCAMSLKDQIGTAMLTSSLGKSQAKKILETLPSIIVLVPDIDRAGLSSISKNIELLKTYKPPLLNIKFYIYYVDLKRKEKVEEIMSYGYEREKETDLINKIKGFKDFNDTGLNEIKLENCVLFNEKNVKKLKWQRDLNF